MTIDVPYTVVDRTAAPALGGLPELLGGLGNLLLSGRKGDAVTALLVAQDLVTDNARFTAYAGQHRATINGYFEYLDGAKIAAIQGVQDKVSNYAGAFVAGIAAGALVVYLLKR